MDNDIIFRTASTDDAKDILDIYSYYVINTAITFEYEVPTIEEFRSRIEHTLERYPYIIALKDGKIVGYGYASPFCNGREAYLHSAELSIYLSQSVQHCGLGKRLYSVLTDILLKQNITNLYACIAYTDNEDEYLTNGSMYFHEHLGFKTVGMFRKCGYKYNRWYDMIWMEKIIADHGTIQPFIPFPEL